MTADDGMDLPIHSWVAQDETRAVVIAAHGMNDYAGSFDQPARAWTLSGITTYAIDQRGFGRAGRRGLWYGADRMANDLLTLARLARQRHSGVLVFLLGESMGGAVAVLAAARAEPNLLAGLVLAAPAIWGKGARAELLYSAAMALSTVVPAFTVPPLSVENPSTDDPVVLKRLREDPLIIHRTRLDTLAGIVALMRNAREGAGAVAVPTLVLLGDLDRHVPRDGVAALLERLPQPGAAPGTTLALYDHGRHLLMRSLNGGRVTADIAAWMLSPGQHLPSAADARAKACPQLLLAPNRACAADRIAASAERKAQ
ncbi:alpha/beta fold hydrolase [Azospirillum thermophilum]|nr:alpha/beta fold hydrolase [Azospirillum thermophilum]